MFKSDPTSKEPLQNEDSSNTTNARNDGISPATTGQHQHARLGSPMVSENDHPESSTTTTTASLASSINGMLPLRNQCNKEVIDLVDSDEEQDDGPSKRQKTLDARQTYEYRKNHVPDWMNTLRQKPATHRYPALSTSSLPFVGVNNRVEQSYRRPNPMVPFSSSSAHSSSSNAGYPHQSQYIRLPHGFIPTWNNFLPDPATLNQSRRSDQPQERHFQLSLLNVNEFTIEGLPVRFDSPPTPLNGLRVPIRKISRGHGKAVFDQSNTVENGHEADEDDEDGEGLNKSAQQRNGGGGRWRIPLGAYHAFLAYLKSDPRTHVIGIPEHQLQIASLERARQEKGYPSVEAIIQVGVPRGLATALAPFQRGGVDFVVTKNGRALIADGRDCIVLW